MIGERRQVKEFIRKLASDNEFHEGDKLRKKLEFVSGNEKLVAKKVFDTEKEAVEKITEKIDYFPFTHGEAIESQREEIAKI